MGVQVGGECVCFDAGSLCFFFGWLIWGIDIERRYPRHIIYMVMSVRLVHETPASFLSQL